jgi:ribosomal protein S18 acetylase RimI-like enzyme
MSLEIVTASFDHLPLLAPLFDAYRVFYDQPSDVEAARAFLHERFTLGESIVFIAMLETEAGTRAVGFTQLYPMFSSVSLRRLWILNDLYVEPDVRGQRVGERLIERAVQLARQSGAKGIQLETAHTNTSGQKLYERMGFEREDLEYRTYFLKTDER